MIATPMFWWALAAWVKTQAEDFIALCIHIAETLEGRANDDR